jgi:DNA-binding MarR family transcriptional regulator
MAKRKREATAADLAVEVRALVGQLRRRLREQAPPGDLSWSQLSVLGRLERDGPATVTALARAEGVRPQSMSTTVATLEAAALIGGARHPTDGRQTVFSLTPAGREEVRASRAARESWLCKAIQTTLTRPEQEQLAHAVQLLRRVIDS